MDKIFYVIQQDQNGNSWQHMLDECGHLLQSLPLGHACNDKYSGNFQIHDFSELRMVRC
jgi:hypothetical protein